MSAEQTTPPSQAAPPSEPSDALLQRFFTTSEAGRRAASRLKRGAEVSVRFTDVPGDFRFSAEAGKPHFGPGRAGDPDFDLTLAPGAVAAIATKPDADMGDLGILFFEHIMAKEPESKIRVKLRSGLLKLTMRGYVGVVAAGGPKVVAWLAGKGLRGAGAIASALSRLKKS